MLTASLSSEEIIRKVEQARVEFGYKRIEIGVLLFMIKKHKLWRGKAESFNKYLSSIHLNYSGATQYINVAEKFYFELGLRDDKLNKLAQCSISLLSKISKKITKDNVDEIVNMLVNLNDEDAKIELDKLATNAVDSKIEVRFSAQYITARGIIENMSLEEKIQLRNELWAKTK